MKSQGFVKISHCQISLKPTLKVGFFVPKLCLIRGENFLVGDEFEGGGVYAVTQACGFGAVGEDVA